MGWRWGASSEATVKQQTDALGAPEVEIGAHDLVEELMPGERSRRDLRQAQLDLPEAEVMAEACRLVRGAERPREPFGPARKEGIDGLRSEPVAYLLEPSWVLAGEKPVVEALEADAFSA